MKREHRGVDRFARDVCRISVAQIFLAQAEHLSGLENGAHPEDLIGSQNQSKVNQNEGDHSALSSPEFIVHSSVIDTLGEILQAFIEQLGKLSASYANLTGRNACNVSDVMLAIYDAAPTTNSTLRDLALYSIYEEVPFPKPIHQLEPLKPTSAGYPSSVGFRLPLHQPFLSYPKWMRGGKDVLAEKLKRAMIEEPSFADSIGKDESEAFGMTSCIESWMPPLPSPHSYLNTPVFSGSSNKFDEVQRPTLDNASLSKQRRQAESSLVRLSNNKVKKSKTGDENPFWRISQISELPSAPSRSKREPLERDEQRVQYMDKTDIKARPDGDSDPKRIHAERILAESGGLEHTD
eukprot:CAMPEP_0182449360 /NCGR_PEP_ID=MMETSP1172-20130603/33806_1 /TAXON_ID=708627 /ORGANISM="Timspurckia oligopyrenoides, Strain CCMP3278" /LENGTH=349 /DNA_ID=CAMNT_0024646613 /DNA_START=59 /DNA_END=1108 /DNA_ORIENTATION=+